MIEYGVAAGARRRRGRLDEPRPGAMLALSASLRSVLS